MRIIYGYFDDSTELIGKLLDTQSDFIAVKPLGRIEEKLIFAALIDSPELISFPTHLLPHCVLVTEQQYKHQRYPSKKTESDKSHAINACDLNGTQRKKHCRRYRKKQPLDASNWKLHISRNRGLKWVGDHLNT